MDHEAELAELHALAVEPRKRNNQDMAGGTNSSAHVKPMGLEAVDTVSSSVSAERDSDDPTDEEKKILRKVSDRIPWAAFLVAVIELCERFTYYGAQGTFQNYISNPYDHGNKAQPGAIGLTQKGGTGLTDFFQFWCYVTPILGAVVSDQYLGKYKTIVVFAFIYVVGLIILFVTSLPTAIEHGAALGGMITSMIVIGLGTGGIKANVCPLIAEQYRETKAKIMTLPSGERVLVDPTVTIQRIYMVFYVCINVGSLSAIATTEMEKHIGFWSAYLLCLCAFVVGLVTIILGRKTYVTRPPVGSVIPKAFTAMFMGARNGFKMDAAKPSQIKQRGGDTSKVLWTDQFVDELKRALVACRVFLFFPIYWVVYTQMLNNFISQAAQMDLHGIPNDLMQNIDPIAIIVFIPILDRLVYPGLRKRGIAFKPITRIFYGFICGSFAMAYAAIVQHLIYSNGPCYDAPLACDAAQLPDGGAIPNHIHVAIQTPAYVLIGLSEIFAVTTAYEYAYTKAPLAMKSFVTSMFLLTNAGGSALAIALAPTAEDPKLTWMYTGLGVACFIAGLMFWGLFSRYNKVEDSLNEMEAHGELQLVAGNQAQGLKPANPGEKMELVGDDAGEKV
ncbi:MAG: peptide transporter ptr2 [Chrysothrix sp. TS-e1954]|nr:MAG: peptide transporter ptr2 [Chrysothrix sp. TS-e1954]